MLWGLDVHMWYQARYRHTRRTCSMVAFFPWQAGERLCEKACGMSFICVRVVVLGQPGRSGQPGGAGLARSAGWACSCG